MVKPKLEAALTKLAGANHVASVVLLKYRYRQANNASPRPFRWTAPTETILSNVAS